MSRMYDNDNYNNGNMSRQRDLVLASNEFCFLQSKTNGVIKTYTGPITMTISAQESLVVFNEKTKQFQETSDFDKAKQLFVSAPESWYVVLKNPAHEGSHPELAKAVNSPELEIGRKVNIPGPCSFSLFPGQMTKVIRGHRLRSNQYLLARVYDADSAKQSKASAKIVNTKGEEVAEIKDETDEYYAGQLLVIKGTEVSFYIPPTGIEVIPVGNSNEYIRDAVTLERLEYAILKDEDGEKRYVHGPAVVFPKPTETFVKTPSGTTIFRALELSPISGIYVKVIAAYDDVDKDGKKVHHPIGEELFITGNDGQMIYYPRPEHAMIQYDGKYMHHAIAIPEGEGRYIMNRLTGEIKTVKGPKMYLPDPRTEVVVKRKLTDKECSLIYPDNKEVLEYNRGITEKAMEKAARRGKTNGTEDLNTIYATSNQEATLAILEANANISRGVSYTKPRTITLDTKYDGVVAINVWTGYAVNVVSKTGKREVVVGPTTRLLDYDETLESMELSTGKPKTTDYLYETVYLRVDNNKISDIINVQTKDFVDCQIKVSYCVNFLAEYKDKWFKVENYVKYLCDRMRSLMKREAKKYSIEDFVTNSTDIVRNVILGNGDEKTQPGRLFEENGMFVHDVEVLHIGVEANIAKILEEHQNEMIHKALELSDAAKQMETVTKLAEYEKARADLEQKNKIHKLELEEAYSKQKMANEAAINEQKNVMRAAQQQAEADLQVLIDEVEKAKLKRLKDEDEARLDNERKLAEIEKSRQDAYAATVAGIMASISPDLVAALNAKANSEIMTGIGNAVSPYAMAKGESVSEVINTLIRGTSFEDTLKNIGTCKNNLD